jgi:hypothetical protein
MWELVEFKKDTYQNITTSRLKVPGGWIVMSVYIYCSVSAAAGLAQSFVADPDYEWKLESQPKS